MRDELEEPGSRRAHVDATTDIETVDYGEFARRRTDPSVAVVDVLPAASYATTHIPGAMNLPYARVGELAADLLPDPAQEIIVYCSGPT